MEWIRDEADTADTAVPDGVADDDGQPAPLASSPAFLHSFA